MTAKSMELTNEMLENVTGGVQDPQKPLNDYLTRVLNLTETQAYNMASQGKVSRDYYVAKLTPEQKAEYDRIQSDIMNA